MLAWRPSDPSAAITRDNAAQMVWNALNANEVEYKTNLIADPERQADYPDHRAGQGR